MTRRKGVTKGTSSEQGLFLNSYWRPRGSADPSQVGASQNSANQTLSDPPRAGPTAQKLLRQQSGHPGSGPQVGRGGFWGPEDILGAVHTGFNLQKCADRARELLCVRYTRRWVFYICYTSAQSQERRHKADNVTHNPKVKAVSFQSHTSFTHS